MTRTSYSGALNELLAPLGFGRAKNRWTRLVGDIEEEVELQKSWIDGSVTVNLRSVDLVSRQLLSDVTNRPYFHFVIGERIGLLFGEYDVWWKNDPNGPKDVAEKVRDFGLPFLERVRSLEAQAEWWGIKRFQRGEWRQGVWVPRLAVTLHRLGKADLVCRALDVPRRRHEIAGIVDDIRALRRYFKCAATENWPEA